MSDNTTLSVSDIERLYEILRVAQGTMKVARAMNGGPGYQDGDIVYGTARYICAPSGAFLRSDEDVRDGYLRVTTDNGWDVFWPVRDLMPEVASGEFRQYNW